MPSRRRLLARDLGVDVSQSVIGDPSIGLFLEFWGKVGTLLVSRHFFQVTICLFAS